MNVKENLEKTGLTLSRQLVLAMTVGGISIWCSLQSLSFYANHDKFIVAPNLTEKMLSQVQVPLDEQQLRHEVIDSAEYDPTYVLFAVVSQSPEPNKWVKKSRKIYLTLDPSGYHKVAIPEVI